MGVYVCVCVCEREREREKERERKRICAHKYYHRSEICLEGGEKINKIITKIILYNNHVYCTYHIYELCRAAVWHCYHFGTLIYIHIVCVCVCVCVCVNGCCVCVCVHI